MPDPSLELNGQTIVQLEIALQLYRKYTVGSEFGPGVFAVTALVGVVQKVVAYCTVVPPVGSTPGTETWYTVVDQHDDNNHRPWADYRPASTNDPQVLRFDWLQSDIDDFLQAVMPTGAGKPTYQKWVHTVAPPVAYP